MRALTFSFNQARYYGLELHAGPIGFDVHRGYLINLLRAQAIRLGFRLDSDTPSTTRSFLTHAMASTEDLCIELSLEDDEFAFAEAVGAKIADRYEARDWQTAFIHWLLNQEGVELWESIPTGTLFEEGVSYELSPDRGFFSARSIAYGEEGVAMPIPPTPYRFS